MANILIVATVLSRKGGTQYIALRLAQELRKRGHLITIAHDITEQSFAYSIPDGCNLLGYNRSDKQANIAELRNILKAASFDVCISMQSSREHLFWAVVLLGSGIPFIYSERTSPYIMTSPERWNSAGRNAALSGADLIHLLLPEYKSTIPECFQHRVRIIGNPLPEKISSLARPDIPVNERFSIISLGRLVANKQPLWLAKAFSCLHQEFPQWDLHFWGEGPERPVLEDFITRQKLDGRVFVHGNTDDALGVCSAGHIFCSASHHEGFPNAVLEAMACGLPLVGLASCTGINSLIHHGINGLLSPDDNIATLSKTLAELMREPELRAAYGIASQKFAEEYSCDRIFDQWEALLLEAAACRGHTVMDLFSREPFASQARLSSAARREWIFRNFGEPMPYTSTALVKRCVCLGKRIKKLFQNFDVFRKIKEIRSLLHFLPYNCWINIMYYFRQLHKSRDYVEHQDARRTESFSLVVMEQLPASFTNAQVLCVGCRDFQEIAFWKSKGFQATGIDLFSQSSEILCMDMHHMRFADASFDVIYSCHSFEHAQDQQQAANEFIRVIKDGGILALEVPVNSVPDSIDLHSCYNSADIRQFFQGNIKEILMESFIPFDDIGNKAEEDTFRLIYKIKK